MPDTYALTVRVGSYEYEGEFYLVGEGYETPSEVLQHVASDHIKAIDRTRHIEQYLLDVLNDGENVPKTEFEEFDADVECGMYADVYYQRFSFSVDERVYRIDGPHIESELESIVDDLRS
jgi:hypothetical protein